MATYTIAVGENGAYEKALVAGVFSEWDFGFSPRSLEIVHDGTAAVYFTTDGSNPVVAGNASRCVPKNHSRVLVDIPGTGSPVIRCISVGTPVVSVSRYDEPDDDE